MSDTPSSDDPALAQATAALAAAKKSLSAASDALSAATNAADTSRGKYTDLATHCLFAASTNCRTSSGIQVILNKLNELHGTSKHERNAKLAELQEAARNAAPVAVAADLEEDDDVSAVQSTFNKLAVGDGKEALRFWKVYP